jgi:hypothetical protein
MLQNVEKGHYFRQMGLGGGACWNDVLQAQIFLEKGAWLIDF